MKIKISMITVLILFSICAISIYSVPVKVIDQVVNYPNPFDARSESTTIMYTLDGDARVSIEIYDLLGYNVKDMECGYGDRGGRKGINRIVWDGKNDCGQNVAKGGYVCRIRAEYQDAYACAIRKIGVIH
jgi:flagellar hook assembly protein FlgD